MGEFFLVVDLTWGGSFTNVAILSGDYKSYCRSCFDSEIFTVEVSSVVTVYLTVIISVLVSLVGTVAVTVR